MKEIREGLEKNLDISFYANSKYNWEQMFHIKDGLEENLDVSIYAKPEFDYEQME